MNDEWAGVAERLVNEFVELPWNTVLQVVSACAEDCEFASPLFLEQAARAKLSAADPLRTGKTPHRHPSPA
jgi:hypothetical protein